jgi:hypothetical protein
VNSVSPRGRRCRSPIASQGGLGCALAACAAALFLAAISACQTPAQKQAVHNAETNRQAAKEIERICALHGDERAAEIKKIKDQSGLELYCPND